MMLQRKDRRHERGQSLVETALGFTVITLILFGLLDLGRLYYVYVTLEDAAGEAALYLSINPKCWDEDGMDWQNDGDRTDDPGDYDDTAGTRCDGLNNAEARANLAGGAEGLYDFTAITPSVSFTDVDGDGEFGLGDELTVEMVYGFDLLTPVIPKIAGDDSLNLKTVATQVIVNE